MSRSPYARLVICAADVGSVKAQKFGWACQCLFAQDQAPQTGRDIEIFATKLGALLQQGHKVALGFECPLFIPVRREPEALTLARAQEPRPWSAFAGAGALVVGMVEILWLLRFLKEYLGKVPPFFLDWKAFLKAPGEAIYFWEALVTGKAKGKDHPDDALKAVQAFYKNMSSLDSLPVDREEGPCFSLLGAYLLWAGWSKDQALLTKPCVLVKA